MYSRREVNNKDQIASKEKVETDIEEKSHSQAFVTNMTSFYKQPWFFPVVVLTGLILWLQFSGP